MGYSVYQFVPRALRYIALLVGVATFAGCASPISTRVTTYQQWPHDAIGATYRVVPMAGQTNNLEFQTFADMVRGAIGPTGLIQAAPGQSARFDVTVGYGNPVDQRWVQRYGDSFADGWGFNPFFGGFYGGGWGWNSGIYMAPSTVTVPVEVYKNTLTIIIKDNSRSGAEVYRASAVNVSDVDNLTGMMPYLAQAIFDGFPGNNGQVREVHFDRQR